MFYEDEKEIVTEDQFQEHERLKSTHRMRRKEKEREKQREDWHSKKPRGKRKRSFDDDYYDGY